MFYLMLLRSIHPVWIPKENTMSTFVNWVIDTLASEDVIDLYFILSDLVDIELSEAEIHETAFYDAFANEVGRKDLGKQSIPIGKLVL